MFDYIKFCKTLPSISDDDEYMVMDECQVMMKVDEGKCPVYHAVFKSRVDRFPKIRKNVSIIRILCAPNFMLLYRYTAMKMHMLLAQYAKRCQHRHKNVIL